MSPSLGPAIAIGARSGITSIIKAPFLIMFRYWKITLVLLALFSVWNQTAFEVKATGSVQPVYEAVGGRLLMLDQNLYDLTKEDLVVYQEPAEDWWGKVKNFWHRINTYTSMFFSVYILFFIGYVIYKVVSARNTSAVGANIIITVILLCIFQVTANLGHMTYNLITEKQEYTVDDYWGAYIPYRGTVAFFAWLPTIADPVYRYFVDDSLNTEEYLRRSDNLSFNHSVDSDANLTSEGEGLSVGGVEEETTWI